jgi:hypothetical protein
MTKIHALVATLLAVFLSLYLTYSGFFISGFNYRLKPGGSQDNAVNFLIHKWRGQSTEGVHYNNADDPGPAFLETGLILAFSNFYTEKEAASYARNSYLVLMTGAHLLFLMIGSWGISRWISPTFSFWFLPLMILTPTMSSLAFSGDVYLYSLYAAFTLIWASSYFEEVKPKRKWPLFVGPFLLVLCDLFRGGTTTLILYPLIILFAPKWSVHLLKKFDPRIVRKNVGIFFALWLLFLGVQKIFQANYYHPLWHSVHAGLFEFGGYVDEKHFKVYPAFAVGNIDTTNMKYRADWSDEIQAIFLWGYTDEYRFYQEYKPSWDELFKTEVVRLFTEEPGGVALHFAKRIWRWTVMNPWQEISPDTKTTPSPPIDYTVRIFVLALILLALLSKIPKGFWLLFVCLMPLALPALLVHSGYVTYSYAGYFPCYLLFGFTLHQNISARMNRRRL